MPTLSSEGKVTELAKLLKQRKSANLSTTLFLGSRAGALFRSKLFYEMLEYSSVRAFTNLSQIEQFAQCYHVLHKENFTESDLNEILHASLHPLLPSDADICLAALVKQGFFDTIISTNIDDLLKQAFAQVKMVESYDFRLFVPRKASIEDAMHLGTQPMCAIIKAFGDFASQDYTMNKRDSYFEVHEQFKNMLIAHLQGELLMIGYDPLWDRAIDHLFPSVGREFWFINEEKREDISIFQALLKRKGKYIMGGEGSYESFIQSLHWHISQVNGRNGHTNQENSSSQAILSVGNKSNSPDTTPAFQGQEDARPTVPPEIAGRQRKKVCIFHSQKDKKYLEQLEIQFKHHERGGMIDIWTDERIAAGRRWIDEIQENLQEVKVAILLISADFLASSFIAENILPPLLKKAANAHGVVIIPVILRHCLFDNTELVQFRAFNDPLKPLSSKSANVRDKEWADLARYVITLVKED